MNETLSINTRGKADRNLVWPHGAARERCASRNQVECQARAPAVLSTIDAHG